MRRKAQRKASPPGLSQRHAFKFLILVLESNFFPRLLTLGWSFLSVGNLTGGYNRALYIPQRYYCLNFSKLKPVHSHNFPIVNWKVWKMSFNFSELKTVLQAKIMNILVISSAVVKCLDWYKRNSGWILLSFTSSVTFKKLLCLSIKSVSVFSSVELR